MNKEIRKKVRTGTITLLIFGFLVIAGGCKKNEHSLSDRVSSVADPIAQASESVEVVEKEHAKTKEEIIEEIFGEYAEAGIKMLKECENIAFDPEAMNWNKNGTFDYGLWQVNSIHGYTKEQLKDVRFNTEVAYEIFKNAGYSFSPWTCAEVAGDVPFWK